MAASFRKRDQQQQMPKTVQWSLHIQRQYILEYQVLKTRTLPRGIWWPTGGGRLTFGLNQQDKGWLIAPN